jgi:hypothetical protein
MEKEPDKPIYFTHEVDGHRYAGWYHHVPGARIEVFTRTRWATEFLGKDTTEEQAKRLLEELVRKDTSTEMLSCENAGSPPLRK